MMEFFNPLPSSWTLAPIGDLLAPLEDGRALHQGWSPQCEKEPSESDSEWGVLKTTAIQPGLFLPGQNKKLPRILNPRPRLEVKPGDLLLTCAGPRSRCGVACLVRRTRPRLMISGKMYRFRVSENSVDPRYLEGYLQSPLAQAEIDKMKTGVSDSGLNLTHDRFLPMKVPLAPILEQHRIVEAVETRMTRLDAAVAALERVSTNLKRYRTSVLDKIFGNRQDGDRKSWPIRPLDSLIVRGRPICYGILKPKSDGPGDVPYVEVKDLKTPRINLNYLNRTTRNLHNQFIRSALKQGDVLVAVRGSWGTSGVVPASLEGANVSRDVARIAPGPEIESLFLRYFLISGPGQHYLAKHSRGVAVKGVNIADLRQLPTPVPSIQAQKRAVAEIERCLSVADEVSTEVDAGLKRCDFLRKSVLRIAFEGRLVAQYSNEEPAISLLKRVGRERSDIPVITSRGGKASGPR